MPLTINVPDTLRKSVEAASAGKNTVLYTAKVRGENFWALGLARLTKR